MQFKCVKLDLLMGFHMIKDILNDQNKVPRIMVLLIAFLALITSISMLVIVFWECPWLDCAGKSAALSIFLILCSISSFGIGTLLVFFVRFSAKAFSASIYFFGLLLLVMSGFYIVFLAFGILFIFISFMVKQPPLETG